MKNEHVLSGLKAKRAEIAGRIETMHREMRVLVATIGHIDATIRAFDPTVDLEDIKPKLPPRFQAFKGEVSRLLLDTLILRRRVDACLRNLRKRGTVRSTLPAGSLTLWEILR